MNFTIRLATEDDASLIYTIQLYQSLGYEITGEETFRKSNGASVTALTMKKRI